MMRLITEHTDAVEYLTEGEGAAKKFTISGPFMSAEIKNRNGRFYPLSVMENAVNNYLPKVKNAQALGELNHPDSPSIDLNNVSHLITNLQFEGNHVMGKATILNTPKGNIARGIMEGGGRLGVSSRGLGSLKEVNGQNVVQNDFTLSTVDIVADPSAPTAFVNGVLENKAWVMENGILKECVMEQIKKDVMNVSKTDMTEKFVAIFESFLNQLREVNSYGKNPESSREYKRWARKNGMSNETEKAYNLGSYHRQFKKPKANPYPKGHRHNAYEAGYGS